MRFYPEQFALWGNVLLGVLIVLAAFFAVRQGISSVYLGQEAPVTGSPASAEEEGRAEEEAARAPENNFSAYAPVVRNNFFGFEGESFSLLSRRSERMAAPKPQAQSAQGGEPTAFIKLLGTVAGAGGSGYAIVADASGKQEVYRRGQMVPGVGVLSRVEPYRIVIDSGNREHSFNISNLPGIEDLAGDRVEREETAASKKLPGPGGPPPGRGGSAGGGGGGELTSFVQRTGEHSFLLEREAIESAIADPQQAMTDARLLPNIKDGKQEGFIIRSIKQGGLYDHLGLQNNDVLRRINQFEISSPDAALKAFNALRGLDRVELDIVRNGKSITLTYQIK